MWNEFDEFEIILTNKLTNPLQMPVITQAHKKWLCVRIMHFFGFQVKWKVSRSMSLSFNTLNL